MIYFNQNFKIISYRVTNCLSINIHSLSIRNISNKILLILFWFMGFHIISSFASNNQEQNNQIQFLNSNEYSTDKKIGSFFNQFFNNIILMVDGYKSQSNNINFEDINRFEDYDTIENCTGLDCKYIILNKRKRSILSSIDLDSNSIDSENYLKNNETNLINKRTMFLDNKSIEIENFNLSKSSKIDYLFYLLKYIPYILIGIVLYSLTIWTIIGNVFVLIAICTNKQLKQVGMSSFLIVNLALSDLLLGITVLPFSATLTTFQIWIFGKVLCNIWLSIDVLCSTASIWGLLVIALDRYMATNHPIRYRKQKNNAKMALVYCTMSWFISITISLGPLALYSPEIHTIISNQTAEEAGLKIKNESEKNFECVLFRKPSFVVISSFFSFFLPMILMFLLYFSVFLKIRQQSKLFHNKSKSKKKKEIRENETLLKNINIDKSLENKDMSEHIISEVVSQKEKVAFDVNNLKNSIEKKSDLRTKKKLKTKSNANQISNSEARITKSLAIIMSCFVACFLPFFTIYIVRSLLSDPNIISDSVMDFLLWLGYFNSSLNPILYALLNVNFRKTYRDLLECKCFNYKNKFDSSRKTKTHLSPSMTISDKNNLDNSNKKMVLP